ncbi:uncharacterized protein PHA67_020784 isoform 1-T3 [Liasis olivaceus]
MQQAHFQALSAGSALSVFGSRETRFLPAQRSPRDALPKRRGGGAFSGASRRSGEKVSLRSAARPRPRSRSRWILAPQGALAPLDRRPELARPGGKPAPKQSEAGRLRWGRRPQVLLLRGLSAGPSPSSASRAHLGSSPDQNAGDGNLPKLRKLLSFGARLDWSTSGLSPGAAFCQPGTPLPFFSPRSPARSLLLRASSNTHPSPSRCSPEGWGYNFHHSQPSPQIGGWGHRKVPRGGHVPFIFRRPERGLEATPTLPPRRATGLCLTRTGKTLAGGSARLRTTGLDGPPLSAPSTPQGCCGDQMRGDPADAAPGFEEKRRLDMQ